MLQLTFNDGRLISINGDEAILSYVPDDYAYYNLINIKNDSVTTEHLVDSFEYALNHDNIGAVNKAAYYAKLKEKYVVKMSKN